MQLPPMDDDQEMGHCESSDFEPEMENPPEIAFPVGNPMISPFQFGKMCEKPQSLQFSKIWETQRPNFDGTITREEVKFEMDWREHQKIPREKFSLSDSPEIANALEDLTHRIKQNEAKIENLDTRSEQLKACSFYMLEKMTGIQKETEQVQSVVKQGHDWCAQSFGQMDGLIQNALHRMSTRGGGYGAVCGSLDKNELRHGKIFGKIAKIGQIDGKFGQKSK